MILYPEEIKTEQKTGLGTLLGQSFVCVHVELRTTRPLTLERASYYTTAHIQGVGN